MYHGKNFLGIIPARGGSKGVPRKNIRPMAGKSLIAWTIEETKKSRFLDRCIVSTEDEEIKKIAEEYGGDVPFLRPLELAQDDTASVDVVLDAIQRLPNYDFAVLLQPTSPFRTAEDIDGAIAFCVDHNAVSCVSVTEVEHSPYWMYTLDERQKMLPLLCAPREESYQRQKLPKAYRLNGVVYVNACAMLKAERKFVGGDTIAYVMPQERSYDIDTVFDFEIVDMVMKKIRRV